MQDFDIDWMQVSRVFNLAVSLVVTAALGFLMARDRSEHKPIFRWLFWFLFSIDISLWLLMRVAAPGFIKESVRVIWGFGLQYHMITTVAIYLIEEIIRHKGVR